MMNMAEVKRYLVYVFLLFFDIFYFSLNIFQSLSSARVLNYLSINIWYLPLDYFGANYRRHKRPFQSYTYAIFNKPRCVWTGRKIFKYRTTAGRAPPPIVQILHFIMRHTYTYIHPEHSMSFHMCTNNSGKYMWLKKVHNSWRTYSNLQKKNPLFITRKYSENIFFKRFADKCHD